MKTSIKSLATVALLSVLALIAGCGGGGAQDPFATTPTPPLTIAPSTLNVYAGTPAVITITSGTAPFRVFSSDAVVLPVTQLVPGVAITLLANSVEADRAVTLTIQDAAGKSTSAAVTVRPSALLSELTVASTTNTTCAGVTSTVVNEAAICSGESGVATLVVKATNTSVLANRQIRFDVLQGAYNFVLDQGGTQIAKSITVLTDQNGKAAVVIRTDSAAPSQAALIRATDVTSGNRVESAFTIVQAIDGSAVLSIVPPTWTVTGYFAAECSGAAVDYLVYGGTAPYTVRNSAPNFVGLLAEGVSSPTQVVVSRSGGRFTAISGYSSACSGYDATFVITDASGRNATATYSAKPGTRARTATQIAPTAVTVTATAPAPGGYCAGSYNFVAASEFSPISWSLSVPASVATLLQSGTTVTVTLVPGQVRVGDVVTVMAIDSGSKIVTATITCAAPA